jgi:gamma-glutamyltranspeptidase/glutathione hydrolase
MIAGLYDYLIDDKDDAHQKVIAFVDAQRLAYADRDYYFGDPDEIDIPIEALINPKYLKKRAKERFQPNQKSFYGDPSIVMNSLEELPSWGNDKTEEAAGTTHLSIIDRQGNAVSMTATIESAFGSHRWSSGFLLNNEMTDFSREVPKDGARVANAVAPNRRPRSSMSPTMVFDNNNNLLMITGSPGGNSIPAYVSKNIIGVLDWGLDAQSATDHPNIVARGENVKVENRTAEGKLIWEVLKNKGYNVQGFRRSEVSGVHSVVVLPDKLEGAADKRREGIVRTLKD